jgi:GntP family gluconate:H+ symporter
MIRGSDLIPLGIAAVAVGGLIVLIARLKINAFVALLLASLFVGLTSGTNLQDVLQAMAAGMGGVLGSVAIIIGLGAIFGQLLAQSGGAEVVARAFLRGFGETRMDWGMMCVGLVVGIGVWFTVGLVLLIPIAFTLAKQSGRSLLFPGIPMLAGLSVMHGLAPPHPGPMAAIALLGADTGKTILYALVVGLPLAAVAGPIFARSAVRHINVEGSGPATTAARNAAATSPPSLGLTLLTIALPILLMLGTTVVEVAMAELPRLATAMENGDAEVFYLLRRGLAAAYPWVAFAGAPPVAMLIGLLVAMVSFGCARGFDRQSLARSAEASLAPVAMILLVVGAGGAFGKVLDVCGVGKAVTNMVAGLQLSPLVLGWLMAALIRIAVGSATVAISTAAGIAAPVVAADPGTSPELVVLAMGAGSLILSHVNDGGFWFVKEYFGLTMAQTFQTWTVLETILAVAALPLLWTLSRVF